ncbi:hypothetical protein AMAG_00118 [Allomyces macrogynus ATCC 38327]|uniref:Uncharacterized protein n=1 Tax=Allomyces macrogynus (strain ATCC 38327) TaxID=578462 RepID=A0A0L0RV00_ALLM3|nr:hypothetical protein AMAG_00118 [Allomyces macrogynus ATCC 38327]|eukprot:KNE54113.1 hypothetical protein AMAG_00118 [Allomyces macrogynus ATCC 38327]
MYRLKSGIEFLCVGLSRQPETTMDPESSAQVWVLLMKQPDQVAFMLAGPVISLHQFVDGALTNSPRFLTAR